MPQLECGGGEREWVTDLEKTNASDLGRDRSRVTEFYIVKQSHETPLAPKKTVWGWRALDKTPLYTRR